MSTGLLMFVILIYPKLNKYSVIFGLITSYFGTIILTFYSGISLSLVQNSMILAIIGMVIGDYLIFLKSR